MKKYSEQLKNIGKQVLPKQMHGGAAKVWRFVSRIQADVSYALYNVRRIPRLRDEYRQKINRIQSKKTIKLYFWRPEEGVNFGDEFGPEIIKNIFGYKIEYTPKIIEADMISVGSILNLLANEENETKIYDKQIDVWGSGYIAEDKELNLNRYSTAKIHAVRGALTRTRLSKKYRNVTLGDPALLASLVYKPSKQKNGRIGVLPHYADKNVDMIKQMSKDSRFIIIDVLQNPQLVISQITECSLVLSSSLHGLITADAFAVPNIHIKLSNELTGQEYKFKDYYSALGMRYKRADLSNIFENDYLDNLRAQYAPPRNLKKIQKDLIHSFPYKSHRKIKQDI